MVVYLQTVFHHFTRWSKCKMWSSSNIRPTTAVGNWALNPATTYRENPETEWVLYITTWPATDRPGAEKADDDEHRDLTDLIAAGDPRAGGARQVEVSLDRRQDDAQQALSQALEAVCEADEHDEADDVVERLQPGRASVTAAVAHVRTFIPRLRRGRQSWPWRRVVLDVLVVWQQFACCLTFRLHCSIVVHIAVTLASVTTVKQET